ncbi:type III-B CRISPR module-associated Cmr3 family protein [Persephonella sp. KM09-Lau-8]|uniref:type III-B CRISPR module-associated Cmr3 family protein n=1 Tax=Persephonella sp. KM09-Lau-8 TaxID=1158345 RepID=UPI000497E750|nr:type III-B CRISPR module-associated Cmr3 family protein [Persephonella sp. KM09-Lau-8]
MSRYLITPIDVLIFGDGKPFNAGEQHSREISFFLNPVPFVSAFNKNTSLKTGLRFLSLYDEKNQNFLFPVPLDIGFEKDGKKVVNSFLRKTNEDFISSEELEFFVEFNTDKKMEVGGRYINTEGLKSYLLNEKLEEKNVYNLFGDIIEKEIRTGIEIDRTTRTTKEKMLFFQPFIRFNENIKFSVEFKQEVEKDFLTIGGEAKIVNISTTEKSPTVLFEDVKENIKRKIQETGYFKIILLTPTNYPLEIEGAKLIAQLTGKPITFSGWYNIYEEDKKIDSFPTRLFKLIPEGSVFYYKLENKTKLDEIFNNYWLKPNFYVHELPYFDKSNPIGFGLTIIGAAV